VKDFADPGGSGADDEIFSSMLCPEKVPAVS
jgi:hypothetical protein